VDGLYVMNKTGCSWESGDFMVALYCDTDQHWHLAMVANGYFDADIGTGACPPAGTYNVPAQGLCSGQTVLLVLT
jgi:hypothetical protein